MNMRQIHIFITFTVGQWDDGMIVPPSDGPMFILIDWE